MLSNPNSLDRYVRFAKSTGNRTGLLAVGAMALLVALGSLAPRSASAATPPGVVQAADHPTLQAAIDALPPTGGVVIVPPGNHEITEPLRITTGDTTLKGYGGSSNIVNKNAQGQPAILIQNPAFEGKATPTKDRLWRVHVADLRITGNEKSGAGIEARYIEEIFIQGVSSSYNGTDGVRLHFCYEDPRVSDCLFTYNKQCGVSLEGCHDIVVSANHFEENQTGLKCIDAFNLTMTGNNLDDHLGDGVIIENTYGSVLSGNMIEECQGWAIILDRDVYGTTISANVIAHDFSGGVDLRDAHGCAVSANTFTIVKNVGVAVRASSGAITISANNFSDTWIGKGADGEDAQKRPQTASRTETMPNEAGGVLLENCTAVVISGNLFSRLNTADIERRGECTEIVVQGNGTLPRPTPATR